MNMTGLALVQDLSFSVPELMDFPSLLYPFYSSLCYNSNEMPQVKANKHHGNMCGRDLLS